MTEHVIIRVIVRILVPYIFMYGLYIQFHGEYSPGGGFQAGVICAAAFIAYGLVNDLDRLYKILPFALVKLLSGVGVIIYGGTGLTAMAFGGNFLGYSYLLADPVAGQQFGIMLIELGVGITVFAVMMLVFYIYGERTR